MKPQWSALMLFSFLFGCEEGKLQAQSANCRRDAQASVDAFMSRDVDAMLRFVHPDAIRAQGKTIEQMRAQLVATFADMDRQGVRFDPPAITGPEDTFGGKGDRRFGIVTQTLIVHTPTSRSQGKGYLLGVSDDRGQTWRFVDSATLSTLGVTKAFPDYPTALRSLPTLAPPTVIPIVKR